MSKNADDCKKEDIKELENLLKSPNLVREDREYIEHKISVLNGCIRDEDKD
jgi:hypothetical protein